LRAAAGRLISGMHEGSAEPQGGHGPSMTRTSRTAIPGPFTRGGAAKGPFFKESDLGFVQPRAERSTFLVLMSRRT
jgi:hypothetical protein